MLYSDLQFPEEKYKDLVKQVIKSVKDETIELRIVPDIIKQETDYVRNDLYIEILDVVPVTIFDIMVARAEHGNKFVIAITKYSVDGCKLPEDVVQLFLIEGCQLYWQYYNRVNREISR